MNACVEHQGAKLHGYGYKKHEGKQWRAHRLAWTLKNGDIPDGLLVLHKCDNRACINVDHLYLGTHRDNVRDMDERGRRNSGNAAKTHCPKGHEYNDSNTYVFVHPEKGSSHRICRMCVRLRSRQRRKATA